MKENHIFEGWPEDETPKTIQIQQGALIWKKQEREVSTPLGIIKAIVEVLDHAGTEIMRPGEQTRLGKVQLPHFLLAVLTGKRELAPEALQYALEVLQVSRSALTDVVGVGRSTLSNFFARGSVSKGLERSLALALIEEIRNPGFIATVRNAQNHVVDSAALALQLKLA